jgi:ferredoxin--NADP+ reductase
LYTKFLDELELKHDNFHYIKCVSRENNNPDGSRNYVQTKINTHADLLVPILSQDNTLIYICGMKGMETGIYTELKRKNLTDYMNIKDDFMNAPIDEWTSEGIKKNVKSGDRMFVEVY